MHFPTKRVQRTNFAERYQLRFLQFRDMADQIINPLERTLLPLRDNLVYRRLPQPPDVTEPDAQTRNILVPLNRVLDGAVPFRIEGVDRFHSEAMQLRIVHQDCRAVKAHRLIVEQRRRKRREIMTFQVRAGIGDQCEARRMGFRKPVTCKGCDCVMISSWIAGLKPFWVMPLRSFASILCMRSSERLKPIALRRSSASPPVKFAAIMAMRNNCS